jgi:hypothetical protein
MLRLAALIAALGIGATRKRFNSRHEPVTQRNFIRCASAGRPGRLIHAPHGP